MAELIFEIRPGLENAPEIIEKLQAGLAKQDIDRPIVFAIGGDGTMLKAVYKYMNKDEAIFVGISAGHLGFLQQVEVGDIDTFITAFIEGKYKTFSVPLVSARDENGKVYGYGFNEVIIERASGQSCKLMVQIDGVCGHFIGDGMMFSTAYGSTGYALAAGGPIVDSSLQNVFLAVPSNPHISLQYTSIQRAHVLSGNREVKISLEKGLTEFNPSRVVIDGRVALKSTRQNDYC